MSILTISSKKGVARIFLLIIIVQILSPFQAMAVTSGPSQPEMQGFQPAGTTEMVDLFSGDFSYNIPLFELPGPNGGYPFNLSYQSGVTLDQEASWVGLGWSLNPGSIVRQMRGLPDEFKGDEVNTKMSIDPNITYGVGLGVGLEVFGAAAEVGTLGASMFINNYKGLGYSIDASAGFKKSVSSGMTSGVGINLSLNSQEGMNVSPSIGLGGKMGEFGLRANYNSRNGLDALSFYQQSRIQFTGKVGTGKDAASKTSFGVGAGSSATLSLASPGYIPQVSMPMQTVSLSAKFNPGAAWWGILAKGYIRGFYTNQSLSNNGKTVPSKAYGYLYYDRAKGDSKALLDFNREKDGMISKETPNLGIPSLSYDIYSVSGQGIGAMYRPVRNDIGIIRDPETISESTGGAIGVDVAPFASHGGINLSLNHSRSTSGGWADDNQMAGNAVFQSAKLNDAYEAWYFKSHGEITGESASIINSLGGSSAVRVKLQGSNSDKTASTTLENSSWNQALSPVSGLDRNRKKRNHVIQALTNEQILSAGTGAAREIIPFYKHKYIDPSGSEVNYFDRSGFPAHHFAGFSSLTPEGLRYNYTIPAYNLEQSEVQFSAHTSAIDSSKVDIGSSLDDTNTEKYLKRVELPKYPHSYLLTSIVGPDYVDKLNDGVTDDDLGYWVKFTYKNTTQDYKWRDPFVKANYQEGWRTNSKDDKGSYTYGKKALWYLARVESKSHVAKFTISSRSDAKGANDEIQQTTVLGASSYRLDEIKLYSRTGGETAPIKTVKFNYDYSLCPGVPNSTASGKLTLNSLTFEYGNSNRGLQNPYIFIYQNNKPYDQRHYDRWGNYKSTVSTDIYRNINFPYVDQDPLHKTTTDQDVSAWSLSQINLPSGGAVIVDYETDDYAYVQHKQAMQMTPVVNPTGTDLLTLSDDGVVHFKLEKPVAGTTAQAERKEIVLSYLDRVRAQVYFKALINLTAPGTKNFEWISGYANINLDINTMDLEKNGSSEYVWGKFQLVTENGRHPFSVRAWQHVRTNQPELTDPGALIAASSTTTSPVQKILDIGATAFTTVMGMLGDFNFYCYQNNWGRQMKVSKSWIRLNSPDKIKYGGGARVSQITIKDNWQLDNEGVYGQVYDYTTEENGKIISSGVAAYEPMIGGEENSLRYAKTYVQSVPLRSDNNLFFEYPINESYYPGPQVGYSKVTVTSLAAAALDGSRSVNHADNLFPHGPGITYGTTGKTVNEFYTAKDFPVITDETDKFDAPYNLSIPIPFLGNISVSKLTTSQGYSIVTNDMHGKQKQMSVFRQSTDGKWEPEPISWVKYKYSSEKKIYQSEMVSSLTGTMKLNTDGTLSLASSSDIANSQIEKYGMGQENEFFIDMRQYEDNAWEGGVNINTDIVFIPLLFITIPIPVPTVWPSISKSTSQLRSSVTNKIIFRPGILEGIEAYDGGSIVKTTNLKWDRLTGQVVLSTVNNNFDNLVYNYSIPAYTKYRGMSGAYQNAGLGVKITSILGSSGNEYWFTSAVDNSLLFPGDEILLYTNENMTTPVSKAVYLGERTGLKRLSSPVTLTQNTYTGLIIRSGFRNQLGVSAGTITALQDPSIPGTPVTYSKSFIVPNN
ncbi:hypothetical protein BH09BAC3_BH09BAC3_35210 [soil metagenome]